VVLAIDLGDGLIEKSRSCEFTLIQIEVFGYGLARLMGRDIFILGLFQLFDNLFQTIVCLKRPQLFKIAAFVKKVKEILTTFCIIRLWYKLPNSFPHKLEKIWRSSL